MKTPHTGQSFARSFGKIFTLGTTLSILLLASSCTKHQPPHAEISIEDIVSVTHSSAIVHINSKHDPAAAILGLHCSKSPDFAMYDSTSADPLNVILGISGLNMQTTYYVRGWISVQDPTNTTWATRFSEVKEFTTKSTTSFTDPRDGQTYPTVKVGNLVWFAENLNYRTTGGCYETKNYNNNHKRLGLFYNADGLAQALPNGWRLPTIDEVNALPSYLPNSTQGFKSLFSPTNYPWGSDMYDNPLGLSILFADYIPNGNDYIYFSKRAPFYFMNTETGSAEVNFFRETGELFFDTKLANVRCVKEVNE